MPKPQHFQPLPYGRPESSERWTGITASAIMTTTTITPSDRHGGGHSNVTDRQHFTVFPGRSAVGKIVVHRTTVIHTGDPDHHFVLARGVEVHPPPPTTRSDPKRPYTSPTFRMSDKINLHGVLALPDLRTLFLADE